MRNELNKNLHCDVDAPERKNEGNFLNQSENPFI